MTAHDVVLEILESYRSIRSILSIIYTDNPNWIDRVEHTRITTSKLKAALGQDRGLRVHVEVARDEVLGGRLRQIEKELGPHQVLGIASRVRLARNKVMQIPMMDFRCEISEKNLQTLAQLLPEIGQSHGFVLQSGRSYHFYGRQLLVESAWRVFLGKCLLMRAFSDERYIGHQLVDGHCVLRLSTSPLKRQIPTVVRSF